MQNNKDKYKAHCAKEPTIPLFSQHWWLDATAGEESWDVALVEENGEIVASMPYTIKKKWGFTIISQPVLTQTLGPWLPPSDAKYSRQLGLQKKRIQALFEQLPPFDYFQQNWHSSIQNWLPVYWMGFKQTTRYTYIIPDISNLDKVLSSFDSSYRNKIKKAEKTINIKVELPIEKFFEINSLTFARQNLETPYSLDFLKRHDDSLREKKQRVIFYAEDSEKRIHSSLYLTWDAQTAYVHLVGEDPELRNSGAGIALIWHAIQYASNELRLRHFDFEGSMLENVESVRRDCGGVQTPYFSISKTPSSLLKTAIFLRELLRGG